MKLQIINILLFIFYAVLCRAQDSIDSVYFFKQDQLLAESVILSPVNRALWNSESYGVLQLDYQIDKGDFRKAQQAYDKRSTSFVAKGFNVLGKFHIGARFEFNNINEDSLSNGLRNNLEELSTFYPYANKSGQYQRQNYILNAVLAYTVAQHLNPFVKLDYQRHWSAGTVDPRLRSDRFILKARPGMAIRWGGTAVSLYGLIGKADEKISLTYKNRVFKESLLYPDRMYHMNYGYGSSVIKDSSDNNKHDAYKGLGIEYASTIKDWKVQLSSEYQLYHNTNQVYPKSSTYYRGPLAIYDQHSVSGNLSLYSPTKYGKQHAVTAYLNNNSGRDGNILTTGSLDIVNYKVYTWDMDGSYFYIWDKGNATAKEIGMELSYNSILRKDLLQSVTLDVANTTISLWGNLYVTQKSGNAVKVSVNPYYSFPNKTVLAYNELSKSEFLRNVVFTDYYFYQSKFWGTQLKGEYTGRFFGRNNLGLYTSIDYQKANMPALRPDLDPTFVPTGSRWNIHVGLHMYLNAQ